MRIALVVPGGVDRSLEYRVIPALLALIGRLAINNDVQVFALYQENEPANGQLRERGSAISARTGRSCGRFVPSTPNIARRLSTSSMPSVPVGAA